MITMIECSRKKKKVGMEIMMSASDIVNSVCLWGNRIIDVELGRKI